MLAGRDPARYGMIDNLFPILLASDQRAGMPTSEKSIAKYMKELGYNTGFSGKWHLGMTNGTDNTAFTPINHGFDFVKFFIEVSSSAAIMPRSQTSSIFALKSLKDEVYHLLFVLHRGRMEKPVMKVHLTLLAITTSTICVPLITFRIVIRLLVLVKLSSSQFVGKMSQAECCEYSKSLLTRTAILSVQTQNHSFIGMLSQLSMYPGKT